MIAGHGQVEVVKNGFIWVLANIQMLHLFSLHDSSSYWRWDGLDFYDNRYNLDNPMSDTFPTPSRSFSLQAPTGQQVYRPSGSSKVLRSDRKTFWAELCATILCTAIPAYCATLWQAAATNRQIRHETISGAIGCRCARSFLSINIGQINARVSLWSTTPAMQWWCPIMKMLIRICCRSEWVILYLFRLVRELSPEINNDPAIFWPLAGCALDLTRGSSSHTFAHLSHIITSC